MTNRLYIPVAFKVFVFFISLLILILFTNAYYFYIKSNANIESMVKQQFNQAINMAENHIELLEQMNKSIINNLSEDHELIKYIALNSKEKLVDFIADKRYDIQCDQLILIDNYANIITQSGSISFEASTLQNLEIVQNTLNAKKQFSSIVRQYDSFVLYASSPVLINNKQKAMLLMGFEINDIMMKNIKKDTVFEFAIVGDRIIPATSFMIDDELMKSLPMPYSDYLWLLKYPEQYYESKIDDKFYFISAKKLKNLDRVSNASLLMAYPSNEIIEYKESLLNTIIISILFAVAFSFVVIYLFSKRFRSVLQLMISQTNKIGNGDYNQRLDISTNDEFEHLAQNFNIMSDSLEKKNKIIQEYTISLEEKVKERTKELEELSQRDVLTGQYNRGKFNQELEKAIYNVKRYSRVYSFIICDIDDFKKINDTYGHIAGDYALVTLSKIFSKRIRTSDVFARWGGEEFVILLDSTDAIHAEQFANGLRKALSEYIFDEFDRLTCSFGVTQIIESDTIESLIIRADKGLYLSKENGKDKVSVV